MCVAAFLFNSNSSRCVYQQNDNNFFFQLSFIMNEHLWKNTKRECICVCAGIHRLEPIISNGKSMRLIKIQPILMHTWQIWTDFPSVDKASKQFSNPCKYICYCLSILILCNLFYVLWSCVRCWICVVAMRIEVCHQFQSEFHCSLCVIDSG